MWKVTLLSSQFIKLVISKLMIETDLFDANFLALILECYLVVSTVHIDVNFYSTYYVFDGGCKAPECMRAIRSPICWSSSLITRRETSPLCVWRKEISSSLKKLSSSHWACCSCCNCAFVSTTVETWPSKTCARCSAASAHCSAASARARAAASRYSEASISTSC